jgi:hypothetical protein
MTDNEAIYDAEIAPALLMIGKRCQELGLPFTALVEWAPGEIGETSIMTSEASLPLKMAWLSMRANGNVDAFLFSLIRHLNEKGTGAGGSLFLRQFIEHQESKAT